MKETIEYQNIHENRKYKDTLFRMVFKEKQHLLDLYNAVNGTVYENPEELEINTLENVLYISMKNDVSFMIDGMINLYEHQSTKNANMPLRGVLYFARLLEEYILENDLDIFSSKLQQIPTPKYIIFSLGIWRMISLTTVRPPTPESNTPIGASFTFPFEIISIIF